MPRIDQAWVSLNRGAKLAGISRPRLLKLALAGRVRASTGPDGRVAIYADDARSINGACELDATRKTA